MQRNFVADGFFIALERSLKMTKLASLIEFLYLPSFSVEIFDIII